MRHILLAVDESDASQRAAEFVDRFFKDGDVTVIAVNVAQQPIPWGPRAHGWVPPAPYGGAYAWPGSYLRDESAADEEPPPEERKARAVAASQAPEGSDIDVALGDPVDAIAAVAEERDVDLIVVGSTDKSFWQRWFGRSVSEELARQTPRPVLIVG